MPKAKIWSPAEIAFILYCLTLELSYETITTLFEQATPSTELRSVIAISGKARSLRAQYKLNYTEGPRKNFINLPKTKEFLKEFLQENELESPELVYSKIPHIFQYIFLIPLTLVEYISWPSPTTD